MEQGEDVVRYATGICVMHKRVEAGRIAQEAIKHEGGFACGRPDDAGMERSVLTRQEGVDLQAGIGSVFGVDEPTATIGSEELPIR